ILAQFLKNCQTFENFLFSSPFKPSIFRHSALLSEALNYIPVFTPPTTPNQKFFFYLLPPPHPTTQHHPPPPPPPPPHPPPLPATPAGGGGGGGVGGFRLFCGGCREGERRNFGFGL